MTTLKNTKNKSHQKFIPAFLGAFLGTTLFTSYAAENNISELFPAETKKTIQFTFSNIKKPGELYYSIYCDKDTYSDAGNEGVVGIVEGSFTVVVTNEIVKPIEISTGQPYCSLLFYIDENGNGVLDRSRFFGLPKEGVGFSRVKSKPLSKPSWEDTRFEMSSTHSMTAQVFYY